MATHLSTVYVDTYDSGGGSNSVTVPTDATFALFRYGLWVDQGTDVTAVSLGGTAGTKVYTKAGNSGVNMAHGAYSITGFPTGSQTLTITATSTFSRPGCVSFFADVVGVRDYDSTDTNASTYTSPSVTVETNDLLLGTCYRYNESDNADVNDTFTNNGQTKLASYTGVDELGVTLKSISSSGTDYVTWSVDAGDGSDYGGVAAIVLESVAVGHPTMRRWANVPGMGRSF